MVNKVTLNRVITFDMIYVFIICALSILFWACLYYFFVGDGFSLGFVMIFTCLCIGTVYSILILLSTNLTIWFDDDNMYIQKKNDKMEKFEKSKIIGFYSFDYETETPLLRSSLVRIKFHFSNKKNLSIMDTEYRNKYEEEKGNELKRFLKITMQELNFEKIKKNEFQNVYWFSKK